MEESGFKAIIVGGSIAGLTLANLFERLNIDYILLEAYDEIAPNVGASIAFHPNGLRVLDQIGAYEKISKDAAPATRMSARTEDGKILYSHLVSDEIQRRSVDTGF